MTGGAADPASSTKRVDVVLAAMPWHSLHTPCIQLGIVKKLLEPEGIDSRVSSLYLKFFDYLATHPQGDSFTIREFEWIGNRWDGIGEWLFAVAPLREPDDQGLEELFVAMGADHYGDFLERRGGQEAWLAKLRRIRDLVPRFLEEAADEILASEPKIVGFSTTYVQNIPTLVLAKMLKAKEPGLKVVFGGANCRGVMGSALHRSFAYIDVVVRGEAEPVVPALFRELLAGGEITPAPGLCIRQGGEVTIVDESVGSGVPMDRVPVPDHGDYFETLRGSVLADNPEVEITYESARGCWWGERQQCSFCGFNGTNIAFRQKPASRVRAELRELADLHRCVRFRFVDNIMAMNYLRDLWPFIGDDGLDYSIYSETKANLRREALATLKKAGFRRINPGIESLSTPILKEMRKGTTGLQNIRLLKWCAQFGIGCGWNILYGFPGELPSEYERMADVMQSLTHLEPPVGFGLLRVERFSPYHEHPEEYGITITGAAPFNQALYGLDRETVDHLVFALQHDYDDKRDPDRYLGSCHEALRLWREVHAASFGKLIAHPGPGFLVIEDGRQNLSPGATTLDELEGQIYLLCDAGATPGGVHSKLAPHLAQRTSVRAIREFLDEMVGARLMYGEVGRYLSLALLPGSTHEGA